MNHNYQILITNKEAIKKIRNDHIYQLVCTTTCFLYVRVL